MFVVLLLCVAVLLQERMYGIGGEWAGMEESGGKVPGLGLGCSGADGEALWWIDGYFDCRVGEGEWSLY